MKIFYILKPLIPRRMQLFARRIITSYKLKKNKHCWPIDFGSSRPPSGWAGWPNNKRFALVLTHDVETAKGQEKCKDLIKIEKEFGLRSLFNFVPERYRVSVDLRNYLVDNNFEVGVHGLIHDGKLFSSEKIFNERASKINRYIKDWGAVGFRSPAMHHNFNWIHRLKIKYDASTFDTDPFEPQSSGVGTIFPFIITDKFGGKGYVELPYTLPQDFTLFILMREKDSRIWKNKSDWIVEKGGMVLINNHPDYMNFKNYNCSIEEYPVEYYSSFLEYIITKYQGKYWHALPREVADYIQKN